MKGLSKILLVACALCLSTTVFAMHEGHMHKWTCETNASSASSDADKKADEMMSKKGMSAKDAFSYALKHCRDCSKITCTMENGDETKS